MFYKDSITSLITVISISYATNLRGVQGCFVKEFSSKKYTVSWPQDFTQVTIYKLYLIY